MRKDIFKYIVIVFSDNLFSFIFYVLSLIQWAHTANNLLFIFVVVHVEQELKQKVLPTVAMRYK